MVYLKFIKIIFKINMRGLERKPVTPVAPVSGNLMPSSAPRDIPTYMTYPHTLNTYTYTHRNITTGVFCPHDIPTYT